MALGWLCRSRLFHTPSLSPAIFDTPSFTHHFVTHHLWPSTLSHAIFYTPLCHTIFHTTLVTQHLSHNFVTHHLWHTTLSHTIFHTPSLTYPLSHTIVVQHHFWRTTVSHTIFHTPSVTHPLSHTIFVTHHLSYTIFHTPSLTLNFVTHHLWHTIFHTPLFHPPSLTHHLSHTTLSYTIFHTPLCHTHHLSHTTWSPTIFDTPSFTLHFVSHPLSHTIFHHTIFHTQFCLTPTLSHTLCHTQHSHTPSFTRNFVTHSHTIFLCHTPSFTYNLVTHTHTKLCFTSRSSTTSFVFPSFPVPATTFGAHYWKKLPCGVIRSFHFLPKESWLSLELCSSLSEKKCESREQSHIGWCYLSLIARIHWVFLDTSFAWPLSSLKCLPSFAGQNRVSKISRPEKNQVARPILQHRAHHPRLLTRHYLLSFTCCSACCTLHIVHHFCNTRTMWYLIPSSSWQLSLTATSEPLECRITQQLVTPSCVSPVLSQACQRMPYTDLH